MQRLIGIIVAGVLLLLVAAGLYFGVPYSKTTDLDLGSAVLRDTTRWGPFTSSSERRTWLSLTSGGPWAAADWMTVSTSRGTLAGTTTQLGPAAAIVDEFVWFSYAQLEMTADMGALERAASLVQEALPQAASDPRAADLPGTLGLYLGTHTPRFQATVEGVDRIAELHQQGVIDSATLWDKWHELELGEAELVEREDRE